MQGRKNGKGSSDPEHLGGLMDGRYARQRQHKPVLVFRYRVRAQVVLDAIRRYLPDLSEPSILDLGCAEGRTIACLRAQLGTGRYVGVELSQTLLDIAASHSPEIELLAGDVSKLPRQLDEKSFDLVSALAILEHLRQPVLAMREAYRMLRPGGLFVATCPEPRWAKLSGRLGLLATEHHEEELSLRRMAEMAEQAGMEVLETFPFMWAPTGFLPYLHLPVPPVVSFRIDRMLGRLRWLGPTFVNQCLVARRPRGEPPPV
jgi:SAM-dependent methyltransferase